MSCDIHSDQYSKPLSTSLPSRRHRSKGKWDWPLHPYSKQRLLWNRPSCSHQRNCKNLKGIKLRVHNRKGDLLTWMKMLKNARKITPTLAIWHAHKLKSPCEEGKGIGTYNCKSESLESRNLTAASTSFLKDAWRSAGTRSVNFFKYFFI